MLFRSRLLQIDYATRELDAAAQHAERILIDFPTTPLFPQVAYWAGRVYFDLRKDPQACRWIADGMARSGDDIEIQGQLGYLYQRCGTPTATADSGPRPTSSGPDAAKPAPVKPAPATPAPTSPAPAAAHFRVQLAAVGTAAAAQAEARRAEAAGYRTVTVQEAGLYKVRAGDYPTRAEAQQAAAAIKAKLGGSPFVVSDR